VRARFPGLAAFALVLFAMARVVSTYSSLSATSDEPAHVRAGLEWLGRGTYRFSPVDPPLSRLPAASLPYLAGYRFAPPGVAPPQGLSVDRLDSDDPGPLALARAGVLPFLALAALLVWMWTRRVAGPLAALFAVGVLSFDPGLLAHAGLATTDLPFTAAFTAALLAFVTWWEAPSWRRACIAGALFGVALACKYTALALPPCALAAGAVLAWGGVRPRLPARALALQAVAASALALLVVWASYRFTAGRLTSTLDPRTLARLGSGCSDSASCQVLAWLASVPLPAPGWLQGLWDFAWQERVGHPSYLLGAWSMKGFAGYYAVGLLVKTPLPELLLAVGGGAFVLRRAPRVQAARVLAPAVAAMTLLLVVSPSRINIGVRHVLPVFPLLAIVAGTALATLATGLCRSSRARAAGVGLAAGLTGWLVAASLGVHPDYLAYFNESVGDRGDLVLLDSDLDWGQDLWRLESVLRDLDVDRVHLLYFGPAVPARHALPEVLPLERNERVTGWIAISAMYRRSPGFEWLGAYEPFARAGRSITVYFVPAPSS
jgi:4-amino-4-deoxy-L-arabinose transferase-like glycosyltransferase